MHACTDTNTHTPSHAQGGRLLPLSHCGPVAGKAVNVMYSTISSYFKLTKGAQRIRWAGLKLSFVALYVFKKCYRC